MGPRGNLGVRVYRNRGPVPRSTEVVLAFHLSLSSSYIDLALAAVHVTFFFYAVLLVEDGMIRDATRY
jgi:hypothetical protein